mgnify:CR=1 FL=1
MTTTIQTLMQFSPRERNRMPTGKIMVVDDDPVIVRMLALTFENVGYETIIAVDGQEALARVREIEPALMVMDVMMPGIDGFQVCERIRSDTTLTHQPYIIILTARGMVTDRKRAEQSGANEFMTKPFSPSQLISRVKQIME